MNESSASHPCGRIVIKVGSNVLTRPSGGLDVTRMSAIVDQIAALREEGCQVILVSSGAVASGRSMIAPEDSMDKVDQRQLYSAIGQARLMQRYFELFQDHGIIIGQVLTMKESFSTPELYSNQRNCISVMLSHGVLPIVNENDTVSLGELMFTDNDELAGVIARMMDCSTLVILSNVDGIFNGNPDDPSSSLIRSILPGEDLSSYIQNDTSEFGRGGMISKTNIARKVAEGGIRVIIANGKRENILQDVLAGCPDTPFTEFIRKEA